jgi:hypothetical protein
MEARILGGVIVRDAVTNEQDLWGIKPIALEDLPYDLSFRLRRTPDAIKKVSQITSSDDQVKFFLRGS